MTRGTDFPLMVRPWVDTMPLTVIVSAVAWGSGATDLNQHALAPGFQGRRDDRSERRERVVERVLGARQVMGPIEHHPHDVLLDGIGVDDVGRRGRNKSFELRSRIR